MSPPKARLLRYLISRLCLVEAKEHVPEKDGTSAEVAETHVTNVHDQPCIHGRRDCIVSMHAAYVGRRR